MNVEMFTKSKLKLHPKSYHSQLVQFFDGATTQVLFHRHF